MSNKGEVKTVVVLNGEIINVGPWDYKYVTINKKQVAQNPLPDGATIEEREMIHTPENGWREVGFTATPTDKERIEELENMLIILMEV